MINNNLAVNRKGNAWLVRIADVCFVFYILTAFLCERTSVGQLGLFLFVAVGMLCGICVNFRMFKFYFLCDIIFMLFCFYQIHANIAINTDASEKALSTYALCFLMYLALFGYLMLKKDMYHVFRLCLNTLLCAFIINYLVDIDKLFTGRFHNNEGIVIGGIKIGGVTAVSLGWLAGVCMFLNLLLNFKDKKEKQYWIIFAVLAVTILLSGTRKALLFAVPVFFLKYYFGANVKKHRSLLVAMIVVSAAALLAYTVVLTVPVLYNSIGIRLQAIFTDSAADDGYSMITRENLIKQAIAVFQRRPATGWGLDAFATTFSVNEIYSHNNFLEILVAGGIVGCVLYYMKYLCLFLLLLRACIKKRNSELIKPLVTLLLFLVTTTVLEYWQVTYYTRKFMMFHIIILAFVELTRTTEVRRTAEFVKEEHV